LRELIRRCIEAVQAEIAACTNGRSSERSIRVANGHFQRTVDQRHVYSFSVAKEMPSSYDDAPVKLVIAGQEVGGAVVGLGDFEVTLALEEYLGTYIAEAELVIDLTFILRKLREVLESRAHVLEGHAISRKAMGIDRPRLGEARPTTLTRDSEALNQAQEAALRWCLGSDFLMVWGPPGTGKTHVLARLLREEVLAGRSVLLLSNTNIAVDQAFATFLELCLADDCLSAMFEQGRFVRLGSPQMRDTIDSLLLDNIVKKLNSDTRGALEDKRRQLEPLSRALGETQSQISRLASLLELRDQTSAIPTNIYTTPKSRGQ